MKTKNKEMKKTIIAILGITAAPLLAFGQGGAYIDGNWMPAAAAQRYYTDPNRYQSAPSQSTPYYGSQPFSEPRPSAPQSRPANPAQAPRRQPITGITEMVRCEPVYLSDDAPEVKSGEVTVGGTGNFYYYKCTDARGNVVKVMSPEGITVIKEATFDDNLRIFFNPKGPDGKAIMQNAPLGTIPSSGSNPKPGVAPSTKPSGKPNGNPAGKPAGKPGTSPKPHVGPTDLPPLKPIPEPKPKPADDDDAPFTVEDIVPSPKPKSPADSAPAVKPAPAANNGITDEMKADRARAEKILQQMEDRLKALEKP